MCVTSSNQYNCYNNVNMANLEKGNFVPKTNPEKGNFVPKTIPEKGNFVPISDSGKIVPAVEGSPHDAAKHAAKQRQVGHTTQHSMQAPERANAPLCGIDQESSGSGPIRSSFHPDGLGEA